MMRCIHCNSQMIQRGQSIPANATIVFVCPTCGAACYYKEDDDELSWISAAERRSDKEPDPKYRIRRFVR